MADEQSNNRAANFRGAGVKFEPGISGNPAGRPKNSVTTLLKNTDKETTQKIASKLTELAEDGDLKAIDMFIDRTDGKPQGENEQDINIQINILSNIPRPEYGDTKPVIEAE